MFDHINTAASLIFTVTGIVAAAGGFLKWGRPAWRKQKAARRAEHDAIVGRPAVVDSITGRELAPALPGIGVRMDTMEGHVSRMADALVNLAEDRRRLDAHDQELADVKKRLTVVENQSLERAGMHFEAGRAFEAIGKIADGKTPDDEALDE